jgi:hypothetical protein
MLDAGTIDAFAGDKVKLVAFAVTARNPNAFALLAADTCPFELFAFALPRNDSAFRLVVNRELTRLVRVAGDRHDLQPLVRPPRSPERALASMYRWNAIP